MDSPNFDAMTDAEINRWAAERDGFRVFKSRKGDGWICEAKHFGRAIGFVTKEDASKHSWWGNPYTRFADNALALCERWGLKLNLLKQHPTDHWLARMDGQPYNSLGPTASRSITNAACAARHAKEMADG